MREWILKHINFFQHLLAWLLYSLINYLYNLVFSEQSSFVHALLISLLLAVVFYSLVYFFDLLLSRKWWWLGLVVFMSLFILIRDFSYFYIYSILPKANVVLFYEDRAFDNRLFLKNVVKVFMQFFVYAALYFFVKRYFKLLWLKAVDELAFLRMQIYPHFHENIMQSFIHEAGESGNSSLAKQLALLSSLMTYASRSLNREQDKVYLMDEIKKVKEMISLIRHRAGNDTVVNYEREGEVGLIKIPPLILLTFIENAIKYGDFTSEDPLVIRISSVENRFAFYCRNKKASTISAIDSSKIGMKNSKERLKACFGKKYSLAVTEDADFYSLNLTINM